MCGPTGSSPYNWTVLRCYRLWQYLNKIKPVDDFIFKWAIKSHLVCCALVLISCSFACCWHRGRKREREIERPIELFDGVQLSSIFFFFFTIMRYIPSHKSGISGCCECVRASWWTNPTRTKPIRIKSKCITFSQYALLTRECNDKKCHIKIT